VGVPFLGITPLGYNTPIGGHTLVLHFPGITPLGYNTPIGGHTLVLHFPGITLVLISAGYQAYLVFYL
jgi:uncharacterized membrane protein YgdD (TMEM256/DUF423 family)